MNNHIGSGHYVTTSGIPVPLGKKIINNAEIPSTEKTCTWEWDDGTKIIWKDMDTLYQRYSIYKKFIDVDGVEKLDDYFNINNYGNKITGPNNGRNRYMFFNEWPTKITLYGFLLVDN